MRRPHPLARAGLVLGGFMMAAVVGELAARVGWWLWPAAAREPARRPEPGLRVLHFFDLGRPNVRGVHQGVFFRTNAAGFRGPEYPRAKPPGVFRIVAIGDSFTMGYGVLEEEAYPALVEVGLNVERRDRRYEVLNLGLSGLNAQQSVDRLKHIGLAYAPDLIVYGFTWNDIEGPSYQLVRTPEAMLAQMRLDARLARSPSYLVRSIWPRWRSLEDLVHPDPGWSYVNELREQYRHNPAAWADFTHALDRLAFLGRANGVCVHVLIHTELHQLNAFHPLREIYAQVARAAEARGMTVTTSLPWFLGQDDASLRLPDGCHPRPNGHAILARALQDGLRRLPARCWGGVGA